MSFFVRWYILVFIVIVSKVLTKRSPEQNLLNLLYGSNAQHNDVVQDSILDTAELAIKYGYSGLRYNVHTVDGYILTLYRIYNDTSHSTRTPVLLMHGMFASSAVWVLNGPNLSFAYMLADAGFDVWIANTRGKPHSRKHTSLNADRDSKYWNFTWHELGVYDLPAIVDRVLAESDQPALHYVGHSQGVTIFFVMTSLKPQYNRKIITMHAMAPTVYTANNKHSSVEFIRERYDIIERIGKFYDFREILPKMPIFTFLAHALLADGSALQPYAVNACLSLMHVNKEQLNVTKLPLFFSHSGGGISFKQVLHYGQCIKENKFRMYDYGPSGNQCEYGKANPPIYDLKRVTAPVYLHYAEDDPLTYHVDVQQLHDALGNPRDVIKVPVKPFGHIGFTCGNEAKDVYQNIIEKMKDNR